jgi:membrane associated rhomboid family serine protease
MIPLCDAIPSRTRPGVVWGLIAASVLAGLILRTGTPILAVVALWLFGPTVEDRLGHDRFAVLVTCAGAAAAAGSYAAALRGDAWWWPACSGAAAGIVAANLTLYPRGRILGAMPVILGFEFVDVPTWAYALAWTASVFVLTFQPPALVGAAIAAGFATGAAGALGLRRAERLRVEWWGA